EAENGGIENFRVRLESNLRAALACLACLFELADGNSSDIYLLVGLAVSPNLQAQRFRKEVDARDADAVQAAGDFVGVRIELAACMKLRHHDFGGALLLLLVIVHGD